MAASPDIDLQQLMERVRENVRERKSIREDPPPEDEPSPFHNGSAADFGYLHTGYDIRTVPLASPRPVIGPLVVAVKRLLRALLSPALGTQVAYNAASTRVITQMDEWVSRLGRRQALGFQTLYHRTVEVERRHAELQRRHAELERGHAELERGHAELERRRVELQDRTFDGLARLREEVLAADAQLHARLDEQLNLLRQSGGTAREQISRAERKVRRIVRALETGQLREWRPEPAAAAEPVRPRPELEPEFDYAGLEERFRGSEEDIKDRQRTYVRHFQGRDNVLDIGCGRGEFLELLAENGIKATGVDVDLDMVLLCQDKGLDVVMDDAFHYLDTRADDSLHGIFGAQVIEHLYPRRVIDLVALCYRKLGPGGILILETPNPGCLAVFAESFYKDPTHVHPLHPDLMQFVLEAVGFHDVEITLSSPVAAYLRIPPLHAPGVDTAQFNHAIERVNSILFGFQDYAVIGRKGPGGKVAGG